MRTNSSGDINQLIAKYAPKFPGWNYLSKGSYNLVYKHQSSNTVFKIRYEITLDHEGNSSISFPQAIVSLRSAQHSDDPRRCIRVWNELNPELMASTCTLRDKNGKEYAGWQAPFIDPTLPVNDDDIKNAIIDTYCNHRRIIVDACNPANAKKTENRVVFIDPGMALRSDSPINQAVLEDLVKPLYPPFWKSYETGKTEKGEITPYPKSVYAIRALLYLETLIHPETFEKDVEYTQFIAKILKGDETLTVFLSCLHKIEYRADRLLIDGFLAKKQTDEKTYRATGAVLQRLSQDDLLKHFPSGPDLLRIPPELLEKILTRPTPEVGIKRILSALPSETPHNPTATLRFFPIHSATQAHAIPPARTDPLPSSAFF